MRKLFENRADRLIDSFSDLVNWLARIRDDINRAIQRYRYPHSVPITIAYLHSYGLMYQWMDEMIPTHRDSVIVDWVLRHEFVKLNGTTYGIQSRFVGEIRFKDKEHATMFLLRFGNDIIG